MKWKTPPTIKIYEALGAVADHRVEMTGNNSAKVYSSSRNKSYEVVYDKEKQAIMANDNGSFWQGYLGYPSIAFLLNTGVLKYEQKFSEALKGIYWKDINTRFKNDFDKTQIFCDELITKAGIDLDLFKGYIKETMEAIVKLDLDMLGKKIKPPEGY